MPHPENDDKRDKSDNKKSSASGSKSDDRKSQQGGTHEQHVKAGQQSHKNDK